VRTDPTDNGGLFVARRPGTKPVHYAEPPTPGSTAARRRDKTIAVGILMLMTFINLLFWGPIPVGWLWIVSHIPFLAAHIFFALLVAFVAILLTLLGALVVLKELDRAWVLVRRAAGVDQRSGVIGRIFMYTAIVGASLFGLWMIFGGGLANSLNPPPTS
jgi:hypothetical protein